MGEVYRRAWNLFKVRLNVKTTWGRNELATLMSQCIEEALEDWDRES